MGIGEHDRDGLINAIVEMRKQAQERGLWLPHMPKEWGGMALGPTANGPLPALVGADARTWTRLAQSVDLGAWLTARGLGASPPGGSPSLSAVNPRIVYLFSREGDDHPC